jgi:hypothetical protein
MNRSTAAIKTLSRHATLVLGSLLFLTVGLFAQDFKKQVIYQIVTDRFFNGDTTKAPDSLIPPKLTGTSTGAETSRAFSRN